MNKGVISDTVGLSMRDNLPDSAVGNTRYMI